MNKELLQQIAYRTHGTYHDLADRASLGREIASSVKFAPKELVEASEIELWNWKYLAGFVILAFSVEWFFRKRSGML